MKNMKNVEVQNTGNLLTLTIDLSKRQGLSTSGKSVIIATSCGNREVAPGIRLGLNVYLRS